MPASLRVCPTGGMKKILHRCCVPESRLPAQNKNNPARAGQNRFSQGCSFRNPALQYQRGGSSYMPHFLPSFSASGRCLPAMAAGVDGRWCCNDVGQSSDLPLLKRLAKCGCFHGIEVRRPADESLSEDGSGREKVKQSRDDWMVTGFLTTGIWCGNSAVEESGELESKGQSPRNTRS